MLLHKAVQNTEIYQADVLSGPTDRDLALASVLERKAAWCYLNTCRNNIYQARGDTGGKIRRYLAHVTVILDFIVDQTIWLYFYRYVM